MKELTKLGIGTHPKQADPISKENEKILREKGQFGLVNSQALLNTVYFYNSKLFGLRAVDEHRNLDCSQFELSGDENGTFILFKGRVSKNYHGGLSHRSVEAKTVKHYSAAQTERSLYDCYSAYLEVVKSGPFYRRALEGRGIRYSAQPIGVNKLSTIVKDMCEKAGIEGNFSNHSGKRSCATTLFQEGVDEQLIMYRTGHRSNAVRAYKRQSSGQDKEISALLEPPQPATEKIPKNVFQDISSCINNNTSDPSQKIPKVLRDISSSCVNASDPSQQSFDDKNNINITNCSVTIQYK